MSVARQKIEHFIRQNDLTVSMLFNVIDTNSDNKVTRLEFKQKLRGLHIGLEEQEIEVLFVEIDRNREGKVSQFEFAK